MTKLNQNTLTLASIVQRSRLGATLTQAANALGVNEDSTMLAKEWLALAEQRSGDAKRGVLAALKNDFPAFFPACSEEVERLLLAGEWQEANRVQDRLDREEGALKAWTPEIEAAAQPGRGLDIPIRLLISVSLEQ